MLLLFAQTLLQFPDIVERIVQDLFMHTICEFLYEVATSFSAFYDSCFCVERDEEGEFFLLYHIL